jgi:hypothetical protein
LLLFFLPQAIFGMQEEIPQSTLSLVHNSSYLEDIASEPFLNFSTTDYIMGTSLNPLPKEMKNREFMWYSINQCNGIKLLLFEEQENFLKNNSSKMDQRYIPKFTTLKKDLLNTLETLYESENFESWKNTMTDFIKEHFSSDEKLRLPIYKTDFRENIVFYFLQKIEGYLCMAYLPLLIERSNKSIIYAKDLNEVRTIKAKQIEQILEHQKTIDNLKFNETLLKEQIKEQRRTYKYTIILIIFLASFFWLLPITQ